jgi:hypothetical protein
MPSQLGWIRRVVTVVAATVAVALMVAGCTTESTSPNPSASANPPSASPLPGPTDVPTDPNATATATLPTQTDTAWGRIWDAVPPSFPTYPGAGPTETGEGPASAILDVGDADPAEVATFYQTAILGAGFSTVESAGPMENGGFQVTGGGPNLGCAVQLTIDPLGGSTIVTILYGAECPFD